ncbi:hypothetical protein FACS1894179_00050 [Bacteroidia bacterium]|nr:hypothetical protein FACS1894179_00050 [Bacteroidia bacterium]
MRKIRCVRGNSRFSTKAFFHPDFLNKKNKIAPLGRENILLDRKFRLFFEAYKNLDQQSKNEIYNLILFSNNIHQYFENLEIDVNSIRNKNINRILGNDTLKELMDALWESLKTNAWDIDKHYEEFFNRLPQTKTCPFCGINQLPTNYRADYDHIAAKSIYPISAICLKNIAPSCSECNQKYKRDLDIFYEKVNDDSEIRRPFNYPYSSSLNIEVNFNGTILPYTDINNFQGEWKINISPDNQAVKTWNDIYKIKNRYINDVLKVDYDTWVGEFIQELKDHKININDCHQLKKYFIKHFIRYTKNKLQKRYILKSALFKYFYKCDNVLFYNQLIQKIN